MAEQSIPCNMDCFARSHMTGTCSILLAKAEHDGICAFEKKYRSKPKGYIPQPGEKAN